MIMPARVISGKYDLAELLEIKEQCFGSEIPSAQDLAQYQKEIREIVKILINLFTYIEEKLKLE